MAAGTTRMIRTIVITTIKPTKAIVITGGTATATRAQGLLTSAVIRQAYVRACRMHETVTEMAEIITAIWAITAGMATPTRIVIPGAITMATETVREIIPPMVRHINAAFRKDTAKG